MTLRRRAKREEFFRDLYNLDDSEDDNTIDGRTLQASRCESRPVTADAATPPRPSSRTRIAAPLLHALTVPGPTTISKVPAPPIRRTRSDSIPPGPHRVQSDCAASARIKKVAVKGKKKMTLAPIPADRQLFPGLGFFFVPNRASPYLRQVRIDYAIAHGATWVRSWDKSITHILVEPGLAFVELAKVLPNRSLPEGIPVVSDDWIPCCISSKTVLDLDHRRFLIKGMLSPFALEDEKGTPSRPSVPQTTLSASAWQSPRPALIKPSKDTEHQNDEPTIDGTRSDTVYR